MKTNYIMNTLYKYYICTQSLELSFTKLLTHFLYLTITLTLTLALTLILTHPL